MSDEADEGENDVNHMSSVHDPNISTYPERVLD